MGEFKPMGKFRKVEGMAGKIMMLTGFGTLRRAKANGAFALSLASCALLLSGCAGGTSASTAAPTSDLVHNYQGVGNVTAAGTVGNIPFWSLVLDSSEESFRYNYSNPSVTNVSITGTYSADNGYLSFTTLGQASGAQGYALVIPGQAALLRPGLNTIPPVITADMDGCSALTNSEQFLFVALPGLYWNSGTSAAYGSVQATTDASGQNWNFSSQSQALLAGSGSVPSYPASFAGVCSQGISSTNIGYNISVLPTTTTPFYAPTIAVSTSGFFTESATGALTGSAYAQQPLVGFVAPTAPLDAGALVGAKYLGFVYESLPGTLTNPPTATQPVAFGSITAGSGTTITGGVFPNDDPSQTPVANMTVNFGTQSSTQSGLYAGATVTELDTTETVTGVNHCTNGGGVSVAGPNNTLTCSFHVVAIAGNPNSKFVVFLIGQEPLQQAPYGLYLYQQ